MTAPTFTCDRCGKSRTTSYAATSVIHRTLCLDCVYAVREEIDQFAGEGAPARDTAADGSAVGRGFSPPSPVSDTVHRADPELVPPGLVWQLGTLLHELDADVMERAYWEPVIDTAIDVIETAARLTAERIVEESR